MQRIARHCLPALAVAFLILLPLPARGADQNEIMQMLYKAKEFYGTVRDYQCVFHKQERMNGKLKPEETILFKFQKPFKVYMKWLKHPNKDRELLFVPGKYDSKLKVHLGGLISLILPSITIAPDAPQVLKNSRHPITNAGMGNLLDSLIDQFELAQQQGDLHVTMHGHETIEGTDCIKVERVLPKDKGYYCHRLMLYLNAENHTPVKVMVYDWDDKLIENYTLSNIQWNVGFTDEDFDSKNRDYAFGIF